LEVSQQRLTIDVEADVYTARHAAERLALAGGFPRVAAQEVALITSELAWNIVRHAGAGHIGLTPIDDPTHGAGIEIRACDEGPPILDLALAQRDGHTAGGPIPVDEMLRRRGIGSGLGAVVRLGDSLVQLAAGAGKPGKCLVVTRFRVRPRRPGPPPPRG
jgi:anti-sigma regulatory factor (Ser/Thr protein kinase)